MRVGRLDAFIVLLFGLDNLEAKLLVEVYRTLVVDLNVAVEYTNVGDR